MRNVWLLTLFVLALTEAQVRKRKLCKMPNGNIGRCIRFNSCPAAKNDLEKDLKWPISCTRRLICCEYSKTRVEKPRPTSPATRGTEISQQEYGSISKKKCQEYSKWITNPILIIGAGKVAGFCGITIAPTIVGGEKARPMEFPHMAHLGYREGPHIEFKCGASLISEQFLLTAAHCLHGIHPIVAKFNYGENSNPRKYQIAEEFIHPKYFHSSSYNDIALLKLRDAVRFSDYIRPACLKTESSIDNEEAIASGWGKTSEYDDEGSDHLLKVYLPIVDYFACRKTYQPERQLIKGLDENTMICAGGIDSKKDTCEGDSGGPLQIANKSECMYTVLGVTAFGHGCGSVPGVYTKVSHYIPWIESIVWPAKKHDDH